MIKHYILVKAKCANYYNFINKVQYLCLKIKEIKYQDGYIYFKIAKNDYEKLTKYLISYKFEKEEMGIFNIIQKVKKNFFLGVILASGLGLYFLLTNLIVEVNVVHENAQIRELLKEELASYGIKVLAFKKSYQEITRIKQAILDKYPDKIDWLEIEEHGMSYDVKIEERIITDTNKENKTCDLIAKKNGMISNIELFDGEVLVDLNDYVKEGDVLITGKIMYNNEEKRNTCARGEVYAKVWYTVKVSVPFNYKENMKTGKTKYNLVYEINDNKKRILKNRFTNFESKYKTLLKIFNFKLYLEKEIEVKKTTQKYSKDEALQIALNKAQENIKKKLGVKDHVIDEKVLKKNLNDSTMDVEIFVITEELISTEKITVPEANLKE